MKRPVRWVVLAVVVVAVLLGLRATVLRPRPVEVETAVVAAGTVEDVVTNSEAGSIRARRESRLGAERAGRVAALPVQEGQRARRGALLVLVDPSTARTQLTAARRDREALNATHESAHAAEALARQQFERTRTLRERGLVPEQQMDEARSRLDAATADLRATEARVAAAEAGVRIAADEIGHLAVCAPFDGVLTRRLVEVGESVVPGQAVAEFMSLDSLYVSAPIDERDVGRVAVGQPVRVTVDAYPGRVWEARVTRLATVVDVTREQNRTVEVEVDLDRRPDGPTLRPGLTADVEIVLDRRDDVLRVPSAAVMQGRRVLVVERGKAAEREVAIGLKSWEWTEVRSGLAAGQTVVTTLERSGLRAGAAVKTAEAKPGGTAKPKTAPGAGASAATANGATPDSAQARAP